MLKLRVTIFWAPLRDQHNYGGTARAEKSSVPFFLMVSARK